jgi:hypothetical protein
MEKRFIIQESDTMDGWVCTDQKYRLICHFADGKFNDTKKIAFQYGVDKPDVKTAEKIYADMVDWLAKNHHDKIF